MALSILLAFGAYTREVDTVIGSVTEQGAEALHDSADRVVMARLVQQRLLDVERRTRWLLAFSEPDLLSLEERAAYDKARALLRDALGEFRSALAEPAAQDLLLLVDQLSEQERLIYDQAQAMLSGRARLTLDQGFVELQNLGQRLSATASSQLARTIDDLQRDSGQRRESLQGLAALLALIPVMLLGWSWRVRHRALAALTGRVRQHADGAPGLPVTLTEAPELRALAGEIMRLEQRHRVEQEAGWRMITGLLNALKRPAAAIADSAGQLASEMDGELNTPQETLIMQTLAAAEALRHMIGDFEQHAGTRRETGPAQAIITNVDMRSLLEGIIGSHRAEGEQRDLRLNASLEAVTVVGDARRLRAMADGLIANAVKFSPDGGEINIILRAVGTRMKLEIEDDGPGIDDDERPHVFEPFFVGKAATGSDRYASGLGLATVQESIRFHRGEIEIADPRHPKRGARFRVQIPLEAHALADR